MHHQIEQCSMITTHPSWYIACLPSFHMFFPNCTWLGSSSRSPHLWPMNGLFTAMLDKIEQRCNTSRACMIPNTCQDFVISNLPSFVAKIFCITNLVESCDFRQANYKILERGKKPNYLRVYYHETSHYLLFTMGRYDIFKRKSGGWDGIPIRSNYSLYINEIW